MEKLAEIGVFGGSGFYKFLEDIEEVKQTLDTPEKFFGIDLDDDDDDEDDDDEDIPHFKPSESKHGEMRFGDAFPIKHKNSQHKFRK